MTRVLRHHNARIEKLDRPIEIKVGAPIEPIGLAWLFFAAPSRTAGSQAMH